MEEYSPIGKFNFISASSIKSRHRRFSALRKMKKYNVGFPSVDFNKSEVLPIRLLPTKTVICDSS